MLGRDKIKYWWVINLVIPTTISKSPNLNFFQIYSVYYPRTLAICEAQPSLFLSGNVMAILHEPKVKPIITVW